jgi:hypothetical protein
MKDETMPQDLAATDTTFDLTAPTEQQFAELVADLFGGN